MAGDNVKKFLSGDAIELVCQIEEDCRTRRSFSVVLWCRDVFFDGKLHRLDDEGQSVGYSDSVMEGEEV